MDLFEAAKFYGDFSQVWEDYRAELCENVDAMSMPEEKILTCLSEFDEA